MTTPKDIAINQIGKKFERFSNLILEQLSILEGILNNEEGAIHGKTLDKLEKNEEIIDQLEIGLEEEIIGAIVRFQPMATDLRKLFAIYHMSINLERVGDLILKVAMTYNEIKDEELLVESAGTLQEMMKITVKLVNRSLISFINEDQEFASWTLKKKASFDELSYKLLKRNIKAAGLPKKARATLINLVDVRSIISSIERIGDHATNIAESSIYAISGADVRHQKKDDN